MRLIFDFERKAHPARVRSGLAGRLLLEETGQALIEVALSLILTVGFCFLVFEFSMMTYTFVVMNNAAREGVRYGIVHGTNNNSCSGPGGIGPANTTVTCGDSGGTNVKTQVTTYAAASLHTLPAADVIVTYPDASSAPPARVQVQITYPYVPFISYPGLAPTMTLTSVGRIVN